MEKIEADRLLKRIVESVRCEVERKAKNGMDGCNEKLVE